MVDFGNLSFETILFAVFAGGLWAYFFFFCVWRAKSVGVEYEEPPVALYGGPFNIIRWISLVVFLYAGLALGSAGDFTVRLAERALPIAQAIGAALVAAGGVMGLLRFYRFWRARQEQVVYEPLPAGKVIGWIALVVGTAGLLIGGPWILETLFQQNAETWLSGFPIGGAIAMALVLIFFWAIPMGIRHKLVDADQSPVWARSSGLELYRWSSLGIVFMAMAGVFGAIPGLEEFLGYPLPVPAGVALPLILGAIFGLFWALPMRTLARKADEGDYIATEFLARVRFSGFAALQAYKRHTSGREKFKADGGKQLCPTCLRPTNDLAAYKNFKFDACPYCGSFIPPVFTALDFVKSQAERIMPLIEESTSKTKKRRQRTEDEDRLVQDMLRALVAIAVAERGTDLHLGMEGDKFVVRCRTDGVLYPLIEFSSVMARPLISTLKVAANLNITERRKPQDGHFRADIGARSLDVRVNTSPVGDGELAAMRLMYRPETANSIYHLGMSIRNVTMLSKLIQHRSGLIMVTGPTGSGKSTTLYNALEAITSGERNIITLEDPIEYEVKGLTQMQVNVSKGFTFANGLRSILRQDPDVIMVGEIRDSETAKMAIDASATGHLVFSTLHATDSVGATGRLKDLGIDIQRVAAVVLLVLAQRLVRIICDKCSTEQVITREELERQGLMNFPEQRFLLRRGLGCEHCHESGYYGREGIYEFFAPDEYVREMMATNQPVPMIRQQARARGMRSLLEDGLTKVLLGRTTLEEVLRVAT